MVVISDPRFTKQWDGPPSMFSYPVGLSHGLSLLSWTVLSRSLPQSRFDCMESRNNGASNHVKTLDSVAQS